MFVRVNILTSGASEEGVFRKAGAAARIKALRQLCEDSKGDVDFAAMDVQVHDACDLLKQFLRWACAHAG